MKLNKENSADVIVEDDIYTTLSNAKKEIWRRWNDKELRKKVEDFLGKEFPEIFINEPRSAIFRFIATPNYEFRHFLDLAEISELKPVYVEFLNDKFCTRNQDKLCLGKLMISDGKTKKRKKIIELQESDNKTFSSINTLWGEKLIDFHHRAFREYENKVDKFDISSLKTNGESAKDVYVKFLALFLCNGILFENYIQKDDSYEKKFTNTVVLPAIKELTDRFNVKPLIVPLLPINDEEDRDWMWYGDRIEDDIKNFA